MDITGFSMRMAEFCRFAPFGRENSSADSRMIRAVGENISAPYITPPTPQTGEA